MVAAATTKLDRLAKAQGIKPAGSYTVAQAAAITGLSEWAVRYALQHGALKARMPIPGATRGLRIENTELQRWFDSYAQ